MKALALTVRFCETASDSNENLSTFRISARLSFSAQNMHHFSQGWRIEICVPRKSLNVPTVPMQYILMVLVSCFALFAGNYSEDTSPTVGASACTYCLPGTSHTFLGAKSPDDCTACDAGKYFSLTSNGTKCVLCPSGNFAGRMGSTTVSDCLDRKSSSSSTMEYFNCTTLGQKVPFLLSGFYRDNVCDSFKVLKCIPNVACLSIENETVCADGYTGNG